MKTYVLYHGNCYDGFGAALAAWMCMGDKGVAYIPVLYGKPMPEMEDGARVYILDFSYPRAELLALSLRMAWVVVLDHHETARQDIEGLELHGAPASAIVFDMAKSGAVLAWEYFHPGKPVPEFIAYLQDRDLWQFKLRKSREVAAALKSYPMDFGKWGDFIISPEAMGRLRSAGEHCLRLARQQVDVMAAQARWAALDCHTGQISFSDNLVIMATTLPEMGLHPAPVANATVFFSEVGERLLQLHPTAKFAAYYLDRADGVQQWGLRSRPDFDCSEVARAFGGGGHPQAAGFVRKL